MDKPNNASPQALDQLMQRADKFARREPVKAVASAFGTGILLNLIPLRLIVSAVIGIAFCLLRPALLFLGLLKAVEFCSSHETSDQHE